MRKYRNAALAGSAGPYICVQHILRFNEARKQAQIGNLHHAEDGLA